MAKIDSGMLKERFDRASDIYWNRNRVPGGFSGRTALLLANDVSESSPEHAVTTNMFRGGLGAQDEVGGRRLVNAVKEDRDSILASPAPWIAITAPKGDLLNSLPHPLAADKSPEALLPHTNTWAQSLYLATVFRLNQLRDWTEAHYPEWLDENGNISPYSMAEPLEDADADQQRHWLLAELSFLRDLEKHGQLFIDHHSSGRGAFVFSGIGDNLQLSDHPTSAQINYWQRTSAGEAELFRTPVPGGNSGNDQRLYTQQTQVLAWLADLKKISMEQALYQDSDNSERNLLLFRSDWVTAERVLLLDRLLTRYVVDGGLRKDVDCYTGMRGDSEMSSSPQSIAEPSTIKAVIEAGLAQANIVLQHLGRHVKGKPATDLAYHYLLSERQGVTSIVPVRNAVTQVERFGLSVNPNRIEAGLAQKLSEITVSRNKLTLNRGYQPWSQAEIRKVAVEQGHLSNAVGKEIGLTVTDKIRKQEELIHNVQRTSIEQTKELEKLNASIQDLRLREQEIRNYAQRMEQWSESAKSQNQQLRREIFEKRVMIGLLSDMLTESRLLFNQQAADFMGEKISQSPEKSHLAEVLLQEGFDVDPNSMLITGMPTSEESFGRMESQREQQVEQVLAMAAQAGSISQDFAKGAIGATKSMMDDLMIGKKKPGFFRSLFTGDDESDSSRATPRFM